MAALKNSKTPSIEALKEILSYDPETGVFTWLLTKGRSKAGAVAGSRHSTGYIIIGALGFLIRAHRMAWAFTTGEWPTEEIDHINGVESDNRMANLRQASHQQNLYNTKMRSTNTSGFKGVTKEAGR